MLHMTRQEAMTMGDRIVVMKDGFIQQVDSPQNLYDYPVNQFVAGYGLSADELLSMLPWARAVLTIL